MSSPTMSDKEALERLKAYCAWLESGADTDSPYELLVEDDGLLAADLSSLIAEREGLEREVAYTEERRAHWQKEAETEHSRAAALAIDYENMSINRDTLKARAQAAESRLSALSEALTNSTVALEFVSAHRGGQEARKFKEQVKANRALLHPAVPMENNT